MWKWLLSLTRNKCTQQLLFYWTNLIIFKYSYALNIDLEVCLGIIKWLQIKLLTVTGKLQGLHNSVKIRSAFMWVGDFYMKQAKEQLDVPCPEERKISLDKPNLMYGPDPLTLVWNGLSFIPRISLRAINPNHSPDEWTCKNWSKTSLKIQLLSIR